MDTHNPTLNGEEWNMSDNEICNDESDLSALLCASNVIDCLKTCKYDYLPLPVGDGVTDDSAAIQSRVNAGLSWDNGLKGRNFLITKTIYVGT